VIESTLPSAPPLSRDLADKMTKALQRQPTGYVARTHHLHGDDPKRPIFTNRLIFETSPYLLQHAHNPVNWYPWGDEAFETARKLNLPVFLSIGYSTCHWCHVMEEESFEDLDIAAYLNRNYICIKVDREERPDVDAVYMSAVQKLRGSGGWPMSVWLTADRQPFMAGTYFPPRSGARGARKGFLEILTELRAAFEREPAKIAEAASNLAQAVREDLEGKATGNGTVPGPEAIATTVHYFAGSFDANNGGLRRAPKFPSNIPVRLLLRHHVRTGDAQALHMAELTLTKMAGGGMYDQLGGGFHRYSTDAVWLVPHFEKMLYDNALLVVAYAEAHQLTRRTDFARIARETLDYVSREMTSPTGGFYSATDADSEGEEGKFFVWSKREIDALLGSEADVFNRHYGVSEAGNFEGHTILNVAHPDETLWASLASARKKLYDVRQKRIAPLRDEKILAAWNGLMISGFAVTGRVLNDPGFIATAAKAADFVLNQMRTKEGLRRSYKDGKTLAHAFVEDYAFVIQGLLDLYEASFDRKYLAEAFALADEMQGRFADEKHGGWFTTAHNGEKLLAREKPDYDGAEPSGTSVGILNALRLHAFSTNDKWRVVAESALASVAEVLEKRGPSMTEALLALDFFTGDAREIAVIWPENGSIYDAEPMLAVLRNRFSPNRVLAASAAGPSLAALSKHAAFATDKIAQAGKATAYVCTQGRCETPTSDPAVFATQLERH